MCEICCFVNLTDRSNWILSVEFKSYLINPVGVNLEPISLKMNQCTELLQKSSLTLLSWSYHGLNVRNSQIIKIYNNKFYIYDNIKFL